MTKHTEFWRLLRENTERAVHESGEPPVRLRGGPADSWVVLDDAPMLREDWHKTWPDFLTDEFPPGHYRLIDAMDEDARIAEWEEF